MIKINTGLNFFGQKFKNTQHYLFPIFPVGIKKKEKVGPKFGAQLQESACLVRMTASIPPFL